MGPWVVAVLLAMVPNDPDVAAADRAWSQGEYDEVMPHIQKAKLHPLEFADLVRATELEAHVQAALGNKDKAVDAFRRLLGLNPEYLPEPEASPKVLNVFAEARRRGAIAAPPGVVPQKKVELPPPQPPPPEPSLVQRWYFWAGVAVAVGLAGGAAYYETNHAIVPQGSLGSGAMK